MTDYRIDKLEEIGFRWSNYRHDWDATYLDLRYYMIIHGNCDVPRTYLPNQQLADWVATQRIQKEARDKGTRSPMTDYRIVKLDEIGFKWSFDRVLHWKEMFMQLSEYRLHHDNCLIPRIYPQNQQLASWVLKQRYYKRDLTAWQIEKLNDLQFEWSARSQSWDKRFEELCEYNLTFGDCLVPSWYPPTQQLANWVKNQRIQKKLYDQDGFPSNLTEDRISELESIDFQWSGTGGWWKHEIRSQLDGLWDSIEEKHKVIYKNLNVEKKRSNVNYFSDENPIAWAGNPFQELVLVLGKKWSEVCFWRC
mmetsp:Transcript_44904/g.108509  ORF Transcript_44904/g.108509 Transcript_44904/m.108509 type:complete len:307 (+) Transcript_44904:49-969(+)